MAAHLGGANIFGDLRLEHDRLVALTQMELADFERIARRTPRQRRVEGERRTGRLCHLDGSGVRASNLPNGRHDR